MRIVLQAKLYFLKPIRIFDVHSQDDLHLEIQLLSQISWLIDAYFRVLEVTIPLSRRGDFFNLRKPVFSGL